MDEQNDSNRTDAPITEADVIERALADTIVDTLADPVAPRCDCPAMAEPHVHATSGPIALSELQSL